VIDGKSGPSVSGFVGDGFERSFDSHGGEELSRLVEVTFGFRDGFVADGVVPGFGLGAEGLLKEGGRRGGQDIERMGRDRGVRRGRERRRTQAKGPRTSAIGQRMQGCEQTYSPSLSLGLDLGSKLWSERDGLVQLHLELPASVAGEDSRVVDRDLLS
jgi:hypothetical protein